MDAARVCHTLNSGAFCRPLAVSLVIVFFNVFFYVCGFAAHVFYIERALIYEEGGTEKRKKRKSGPAAKSKVHGSITLRILNREKNV